MGLKQDRFYLLDFYRAIAAFSIVIFHYRIFYGIENNLQDLILNKQPFYNIFFFAYESGWLAVQFFFILSGFIFFNLYLKKINNKKISFKNFFILRFSRLYPLHILTFFLVFLISFVLIEGNFLKNINLKHIILNIFLIQNWGFEDGPSFNEPSWSISIEILMYSIFFFLAKTRRFLILLTFLLIILSSIIFFKYKLIGYGGFCFFIGGLTNLIFEFLKKNNYLNGNNWLVFCLLLLFTSLIVYIMFTYNFSPPQLKVILIVFFFPSLILTSIIFPKKNALIIKKISIVGNFSYSIYMIHFVIQLMFIFSLNKFNIFINFNSLYFFSIYILACIFVSIISFYYFETPMQNFIRKKLIF